MQTFEMQLAGRRFQVETGKFAKQAGGSVMIRYGDTAVLVAATASDSPREGIDFFPLTVDYEEKMYAAGKIPGGFIKREGRPPETAILASRLIDRPIRPLFSENFRNDVQVVATVMSIDPNAAPDVSAIIGASCALGISDVPFEGPVGAVRVGYIDGNYVINPTDEELKVTELNMVVAGTKEAILMVEAGVEQLSEEIVLNGILHGHEVIKEIVAFQEQIIAQVGKTKKTLKEYQPPTELQQAIQLFAYDDLKQAVANPDKLLREENIRVVKEEVMIKFLEEYPENKKDIGYVFGKMLKDIVRKMITHDKIRPDGRGLAEIRPIACETHVLPRTHGTGLFTRGQTQALTITTLGGLSEDQMLDGIGPETSKRYMHHYNFPSYSVGETRPMRSPGRREIGHGALAERALVPVIPSETEFPYTIRVVSEILESNGSSSMASVCGSTLSLMDAGVPIKAPVSGIAMGLVKDGDHHTILTDIQGMEDALGDMDFKVAGTKDGITAIQMDIKIHGINREILESALEQARAGRLFILDKMLSALPSVREEMSPFAPRIIQLKIDPDKIRDIIGPGGKMIKKIVEESGAKIDVEDDGRVFIGAVNPESGEKARKMIESLTKEVQVGEIYTGKVARLMAFGAFVELLPGKDGLVHISQLALDRVEKVEDVVKVGDEITVKVIEIDRQGRINLSRKEILKSEAAAATQE
ncbi:MAG: polyribonucleotide nucleotidyltransferase [Negativicutes bacterium]|nr:polyribonucleotide nucleotidyltransferase [Negativicutes bacterium]